MDFSQKYQLIELLPGEGVQSYRARQTNTGRDVTVHLLVGGKTPENEAFLVRLRAMQPHSMAKLIEVGEYQGDTFVVTVAPPYQRLDEWLAEQDRAAAAAKEFGKAGFWKRPEVGSLAATAARAKAPEPPPPRAPEPGEFTKQFQRPAAPAPEPGLPAASPVTEPGEFTRMFQSPAAPPPSAATTQITPPPPPAPPSTNGARRVHADVPDSAAPPPSAATTQVTPPPSARASIDGAGRVHENVPGSAGRAPTGTRKNASAASRSRRVHAHVPIADARCAAPGRLAATGRQTAGTGRVHAHVPGAAAGSGPPAAGRRRVHAVLQPVSWSKAGGTAVPRSVAVSPDSAAARTTSAPAGTRRLHPHVRPRIAFRRSATAGRTTARATSRIHPRQQRHTGVPPYANLHSRRPAGRSQRVHPDDLGSLKSGPAPTSRTNARDAANVLRTAGDTASSTATNARPTGFRARH